MALIVSPASTKLTLTREDTSARTKEDTSPPRFFFKCVMLGDTGVGKTSLANRLATGHFLDCPLATFSSSTAQLTFRLTSGAKVQVDLWDTAGQERYRSLTTSYYRHAKVVVIVFDAERKLKIADWLREIQCHVTPDDDHWVFLLGNKLDLGDDVMLTEDELDSLSRVAGGVNIDGHFAVSAKSGQNVQDAFTWIAEAVCRAAATRGVDLSKKSHTVRLGLTDLQSRSAKRDKCCS